MKYLQLFAEGGVASGPLAYYHLNNRRDRAPLLDELAAVIDHVQPRVKGGRDTEGNLVTACNRCNMRKNDRDAVNLPPRHIIKARYGEPQHWDGLTAVFIKLAGLYTGRLTPSERAWLKALQAESAHASAPADQDATSS